MKRKGFLNYAPYILTSVFLLTGCTGGQLRGKSPGRDYFSNDFRCKNGILPHEEKKDYLQFYEGYRKLAFQNRKNSVFAVITGDSTSALFSEDRLKKYIPDFEVINRGIGGDTTSMMLRRLDEDIVSLQPRIIIIEIGGNDILGGRCLSSVLQNTEMIVNHLLKKLPNAEIIMVSIPPVVAWKANTITPFYNRQLEYLTEKNIRVSFMDLWPSLSDQNKPELKKDFHFFLPGGKLDYVHLNEEGYRKWGELITSHLKKLSSKAN